MDGGGARSWGIPGVCQGLLEEALGGKAKTRSGIRGGRRSFLWGMRVGDGPPRQWERISQKPPEAKDVHAAAREAPHIYF